MLRHNLTSSQLTKLVYGLSCTLLAGFNWLGYFSFLTGYLPGIYPLAVIYSTLIKVPAILLVLGTLYLWFPFVIAGLLCGIIASKSRRAIYRQLLRVFLLLPLLILVFFPVVLTFDSGQSLTVKSWGHTYRTAYSSLVIDDNYGDALVFECDRIGVFCHRVYKFYSYYGVNENLEFTYNSQRDRLSLIYNNDEVVYQRSQH